MIIRNRINRLLSYKHLLHRFKSLGMVRVFSDNIAGVGRIGEALMSYGGFQKDGIKITAGFDIDVKKIKRTGEIPVKPIEELEDYVRENNISVAIMAVPDIAVQQTLERLKAAKIKGILNFSPVKFNSTEEITINNFNIENELVNLIYFVNKFNKNGQEIINTNQ